MNRRSFVQNATLLGLSTALPLNGQAMSQASSIVKPTGVPKKATIGLITPGSALSRSAFERTLKSLTDLGHQVKYTPNIRVRSDFLSGTDQQRVADIHQMFSDPEVEAIYCARGGYGCSRLLDSINYDIIRANPKVFLGYSDITALHLAFYAKTGMVCFHGPVGASEWNDFSADYVVDQTSKGRKVKIKAEEPLVITQGDASGKLVGGNLSLLCSLIGTPYDVDYSGHILFMEDVGESTYRIDRMLTQLRSSGKLDKVAGIALGYFTDCDTSPDSPYYEYSMGLNEVFKDRLGDLGIPVMGGLPFGHEPHNATLPIGIEATLDTAKGELKTNESAIQ
ncbi:MAG: muramoyltetrapeptide carboxypeptidase [Cyclobacteriaceae bacterium]|jgi:muramoyltetrapeptide carboxypeptidase